MEKPTEQHLETTTLETGEAVSFYEVGEDVQIERANGHRHFYCPTWYWPMRPNRKAEADLITE